MNTIQQLDKQLKQYEQSLLDQAIHFSPFVKNTHEHHWIKATEPIVLQLNHFMNQESLHRRNEAKVRLHETDSDSVIREKEAQLDLELTKLRVLSFGQGFLLSKSNKRMMVDLPLQLVGSMHAIQRIAHFYGFPPRSAFESIYTMRILNYSLLPSDAKLKEWDLLAEEIEDTRNNQALYFGKEDIVSQEMAQVFIKQVAKWAIIRQVNLSKLPGKRVFSGAINAGTTYWQAKKTIVDARMFYTKRWLLMNV